MAKIKQTLDDNFVGEKLNKVTIDEIQNSVNQLLVNHPVVTKYMTVEVNLDPLDSTAVKVDFVAKNNMSPIEAEFKVNQELEQPAEKQVYEMWDKSPNLKTTFAEKKKLFDDSYGKYSYDAYQDSYKAQFNSFKSAKPNLALQRIAESLNWLYTMGKKPTQIIVAPQYMNQIVCSPTSATQYDKTKPGNIGSMTLHGILLNVSHNIKGIEIIYE